MKKTLFIFSICAALAADAARVTSANGVTINAEVVSYADGIFVLRSENREAEYPAEEISSIEFEDAEKAAPAADLEKIDIRKVSVLVSSMNTHDSYRLKPAVHIDCRAGAQEFKQRPFVLLRLNLLESRTKTIIPMVCWYDWEGNRGWREFDGSNEIDPAELSMAQPQCDWRKLSPISLDCYETAYRGVHLRSRHTVAAVRAEVWYAGNMVACDTEREDWDVPLPASWK